MSVESTVIYDMVFVQLTKNHLFGWLNQLNKTPWPAFGSTDPKVTFLVS
jgi:hypothetical protein